MVLGKLNQPKFKPFTIPTCLQKEKVRHSKYILSNYFKWQFPFHKSYTSGESTVRRNSTKLESNCLQTVTLRLRRPSSTKRYSMWNTTSCIIQNFKSFEFNCCLIMLLFVTNFMRGLP